VIPAPTPDELLGPAPGRRPRPRCADDEFTAFVHEHHRRLLRVAELLTGDRGRTVSLFDVPDPVAAFGDIAVVDAPSDPATWVAVR
jgi:hypothetical protein